MCVARDPYRRVRRPSAPSECGLRVSRYYLGMACVLPFSCQPLPFAEPQGVPWRKVLGITAVDFASQFILLADLTVIGASTSAPL